MIQRIFLCVPLIFKLMPILLAVMYIYAILGMQFFDTSKGNYDFKDNPYDTYNYADFTSFGGALLLLF